jgi:hypothetical protein
MSEISSLTVANPLHSTGSFSVPCIIGWLNFGPVFSNDTQSLLVFTSVSYGMNCHFPEGTRFCD